MTDNKSYKWLPVIAQDDCTGCGICVQACDHKCLELVWSFATLQSPELCGSEGNCMEACPEGVITMQWVVATGDVKLGQWTTALPSTPAGEKRRLRDRFRDWFDRFRQDSSSISGPLKAES